jgi:hypothetical protein
MISNILSDHRLWLALLLSHHHFADKLFNLFYRLEHPSGQYLTHLTHLVLKVIQAGKHTTLLKLKKPLLRVVMQDYSSERK